MQLASAIAVGGVLAFLTSARAHHLWRATRARPIAWFWAGFLLLAVAQIAAFGLEIQGVPKSDGWELIDSLFWFHYASLLAGLACVFASFGRHPFRWSPALAILLVSGVLLQFLAGLILFFIVLHAGLNHIRHARAGSFRTTLGFFCLLLGHLLNLFDYYPTTPRNVVGEAFGVVGFFLLLLSVPRPPRTT